MQTIVTKEHPLKDMIVDYVGNKLHPEDECVTVEMIVSVLAEEFPELVMLIAAENYERGYQDAVSDAEFLPDDEDHSEQQ